MCQMVFLCYHGYKSKLGRGSDDPFSFPAAVALLLAGQDPWLAGWYARYLQSMSCVLFGVSLIGPLLLEDVLRRTL